MSNNLENIQPKLKALAIYQIAGGIIGIGLTIYLIATINSLAGLVLLIILLAIGLFGYSVYCGVTLLKNPYNGLRLSKINQVLQVVGFTGYGYSFQYISGIHFSPGLDLTNSINFKMNLSLSTWQININTGEPDTIVSLNLVALFLIVFIDKSLLRFKALEFEEEIAQIGQQEEAKQFT